MKETKSYVIPILAFGIGCVIIYGIRWSLLKILTLSPEIGATSIGTLITTPKGILIILGICGYVAIIGTVAVFLATHLYSIVKDKMKRKDSRGI